MTSRAALRRSGALRQGTSSNRDGPDSGCISGSSSSSERLRSHDPVFSGTSAMASLLRAFDWAKVDCAPPAMWPANLRFAMGLCLTSHTPMAIWWGPSLTMFYNDAFIPFLGRLKHPQAVARPCWDVWPEVRAALEPMIEAVRTTGNAIISEDGLGFLECAIPAGEEVCVSLSLHPIHGSGDQIDGVFCTCAEGESTPTKKIRGYEERLRDMAFDAVVAEERERRRIAADLHDGVGQSLSLAQIKLTSVSSDVSGAAREILDDVIELLDESIAATRTLTFDLSPPLLYDLGIRDALSWLIEKLEKRHGSRIELTDDGEDKPLDDVTAGIVFRAARELLTNVLKHARTSKTSVSLRRTGRHVELVVEDLGRGFDPDDTSARHSGFGLFSVREQITRLGGVLEITSAPNQGARIRMEVPIRAFAPPAPVPVGAKS